MEFRLRINQQNFKGKEFKARPMLRRAFSVRFIKQLLSYGDKQREKTLK
jgi:hypothetical protein